MQLNTVSIDIIAGIVQVLPLILIPLALKGILDEIPVLGKAARNAMNRANSAGSKYAKSETGFFGRRRAAYNAGERTLFGRQNSRNRQTIGQFLKDRDESHKEAVEASHKVGKDRYMERVSNADTDLKGGSLTDRQARYARTQHDKAHLADKGIETSGKRLEDHAAAEEANPTTALGRLAFERERLSTSIQGHKENLNDQINNEKEDATSTLGQLDLRRRNFGDSAAASAERADANWKEANTELGKVDSVTGQKIYTPEQQQIRDRLAAAGINQDTLVTRTSQRKAAVQSGVYATNKQTEDYANSLSGAHLSDASEEDKTLLKIAGGRVDPENAQMRARASAVNEGFSIDEKNIAANRALLTSEMSAEQSKPDTDLNKRNPNELLEDALKSDDIYQASAARDLLMTQGASGVEKFREIFLNLDKGSHFKAGGVFKTDEEARSFRTTLARTSVSQHGRLLKEKSKDFMTALSTDRPISDTAEDPSIAAGMNDQELAGSSNAFLVRSGINGGVSPDRASAILADRSLDKVYNEGQREILKTISLGTPATAKQAVEVGWNPNSGKATIRPDSATIDAGDNDPTAAYDIRTGNPDVPPAGSPSARFKEYIDNANGVQNLSTENLIKLQNNVALTPIQPDDTDIASIRSAIMDGVKSHNAMTSKLVHPVDGKPLLPNVPDALSFPQNIPRPIVTQRSSPQAMLTYINQQGGIENVDNNAFNIIRSNVSRTEDTSPEMSQLINQISAESQKPNRQGQ